MLRSRDSRKEAPLPADLALVSPAPDPSDEALMAESVGLAMLVVLQTLTPSERVAFVLHDTFGLSFEEIAPIVGRSPAAARQLASRARRRVQGSPSPDASAPREVVRAFLAAAQGGDFQALLALLDPSAVLRSDPAAVEIGAPASLSGPEAVAGRFSGAKVLRLALIDGAPGLVWARGGRPKVVFTFTLRGGKVKAIDLSAAPERLAGLKVEFF
jgi:RNA polymerase sigma-70 factor (ECF subfamily)